MTITINVTENDIKRGKKGNCNNCPVALAFSRVIKSGYDVKVGSTSASIYNKSHELVQRIYFPDEVLEFIRKFDNFDSVKPLSFQADIDSLFLLEERV